LAGDDFHRCSNDPSLLLLFRAGAGAGAATDACSAAGTSARLTFGGGLLLPKLGQKFIKSCGPYPRRKAANPPIKTNAMNPFI
jgi:hypothetical protein